MENRNLVIVSIFSVVGLIGACRGDQERGGADRSVVYAQGSHIFPSETISDIVSYAEHLVQFKVTGEEAFGPTAAEVARGEGTIGRRITLEFSAPIWSSGKFARPLPRVVQWNAMGWVLDGAKRIPMAFANAPRFEVGGSYIGPVVAFSDAVGAKRPNPEWGPLSSLATFPVRGDDIGARDLASHGPLRGAAALLETLERADMKRLLDETKPDPRVEPFMHQSPGERRAAVYGRLPVAAPDASRPPR